MIPRLIVLALIGISLYFLVRLIASQFNISFNRCKECNGLGYWKGTRGEKNECKACHGTGKRK
jgi:DnaJ-class molecular chaperone